MTSSVLNTIFSHICKVVPSIGSTCNENIARIEREFLVVDEELEAAIAFLKDPDKAVINQLTERYKSLEERANTLDQEFVLGTPSTHF